MYKFQLKTFPNGLRLLMIPSKESLSFQITVLVNTGADFETKKINGISHFLEHMCFKGTKKLPSNLEIAQELDSIGGAYNAFTGREYTGYYARVSKEHKELAIDIVSDIYLNSLFPEEEIQKEKGVIIEEINMYHDEPQSYVGEIWERLLYGNQPAGWPIAGTKENIQRMSRNDFLTYHKSQYRSQSTLIVISGNFNNKEVTSLVKKYFLDISRGKAKTKGKAQEAQKEPKILLEQRKIDQTHIILGVRGINLFDKRRYALNVLDTVLDGGMSSRLFQLVRGKLGAAYYVNSLIESKIDTGYWAINAGLDSLRFEMVIKAIIKEWQSFKTLLVSPKEIKKAKDFLAGQIALRFEDVHTIALSYGTQLLLTNKIETPQQYLTKIRQVTPKDLRQIALDLLTPQSLNLASIGFHQNKVRLQKLLTI
ncbi:MAG: pitrilysin family protein [Candidatus Falkowbacteria bacterium]|nr:pitrilysin family protein [Candidatus Falkowbacteria bacterium]